MSSFMSIQTIGKVGNSPRFYKQGKRLALNGFVPGILYSAEIDRDEGIVVLKVNPHGTRVVSKKSGTGDDVVPVIDVQSIDALSIFDGMDKIRVILEDGQITLMGTATEIRRRERTERLKKKLESGEPLTIGSTSHGIGVLSHAIHSGIEYGGLHAELAFANDIEPAYLDQSEAHNSCVTDATVMIAAPLQELAFDMDMLGRLKSIDVLEAGIPCTGASVAGRAKKHLAKPEDDPNVGHLIVGFLTLVQRLNPAALMGCDTYIVKETSTCRRIRKRVTLCRHNYVSIHSNRPSATNQKPCTEQKDSFPFGHIQDSCGNRAGHI